MTETLHIHKHFYDQLLENGTVTFLLPAYPMTDDDDIETRFVKIGTKGRDAPIGKIESIWYAEFLFLTHQDAEKMGFETLEDMREFYKERFPRFGSRTRVGVVRATIPLDDDNPDDDEEESDSSNDSADGNQKNSEDNDTD